MQHAWVCFLPYQNSILSQSKRALNAFYFIRNLVMLVVLDFLKNLSKF